MSSVSRQVCSELLDAVARKVADMALAMSPAVNKDDAAALGLRVANMLAEDWGGTSVYVPKDVAGRLTARNRALYAEFRGDNIHEIARRYGLSEQRVYSIIKHERDRRKVRHLSLPGIFDF